MFSAKGFATHQWHNASCFIRSLRHDTEIEETLDLIRNAHMHQLNVALTGELESHLRQFLLRLPENVGLTQLVAISAFIVHPVAGDGDEQTATEDMTFTIMIRRDYRSWGSDAKSTSLQCDRNIGAPLLVPLLIRHVARRYTGVHYLDVTNDVYHDTDAFGGVTLQDILKPFADAGHWKTTLKEIVVKHFDLSLDNDNVEFQTYPESLESVHIAFPSTNSKRDMHSTLFKMMLHSHCLKAADGCGHCGVLSPLAVQCLCELMLKTTKSCDTSRASRHEWDFYHCIAPWFPLYPYVIAKNRDAIQKELSRGCITGSGMELSYPQRFGKTYAEETVAMVYHFAVLSRFRALIEDDENGRLLIPLFLSRLQLNRRGDPHATTDVRHLLFAIFRDFPFIFGSR